MAIKQLNPYLNLNGTAEKAIKFYEHALGAKAETVMRFGDASKMGQPMPADQAERIMHAQLRIGEGVLMLSDCGPETIASPEHNGQIALDFDDVEEGAKRFEALAVGGKVIQPLEDAFWGGKFGMLADQFGVRWMFNCTPKNR